MRTLVLTRLSYMPEGTVGTYTLPDGSDYITIERPWANNVRNVSCIPIGSYLCKPRRFNKGNYPAIHITGVPNRGLIMFHKGNKVKHSLGCVLPNVHYTYISSGIKGVNSKGAFNPLMKEFGHEEFMLTIRNSNCGIIN